MNISRKVPSVDLIEIANFLKVETNQSVAISGISSSSREIEPGDIFIALPGSKEHGASYCQVAKEKGAVAILTDSKGKEIVGEVLPTIVIESPRSVIGPLSSWFYRFPSDSLDLYGITGTNGKTTTTYLLNQLWKRAGRATTLIGTLGVEILGEKFSSSFTTPEADQLQKIFATSVSNKVRNIAMEVSSIAIEMQRTLGTKFRCSAFTNLTQDHLDFHGTMEKYGKAKAKLFTLQYSEFSIINIDDDFGAELFANSEIPTQSVSRFNPKADWYFERIEVNGSKTEIAIRGIGGILIESKTTLIGGHNLDNLILAIALAVHSGIDPLVVAATIPELKGAPGRLEVIDEAKDFIALVDYAHTPDAVRRVLTSVKHLGRKVIAVLGCGGDRDRSKRHLMGDALRELSDVAIFTSDNPRSEDPNLILDEMIGTKGLTESQYRIEDRREAIATAVTMAEPGDILIILGKGHETGQEINGKILPFSDVTELKRAVEELR